MGKDSPPAPDYVGAAQATADSSKEVTNQQTYANRPDVYTPWGKQTYSQSEAIDPATGQNVTKWQQHIELTPAEQQALDSQQAIQQGRSNAAQGLLKQSTDSFNTPFDWDSLPQGAGSVNSGKMQGNIGPSSFNFGDAPSAATDYRQKAQDAVNALQQPGLDAARTRTTAALANQGLSADSEAYKNAMRDVDDNENRAHLAAIDSGRSEAAQNYNQDLSTSQFENQRRGQDTTEQIQRGNFNNQANTQQEANDIQAGQFNNSNRQARIAEGSTRRSMSLNELNALLTGQQVQNPQFGGTSQAGAAQGVNASGALNSQYGAQVDAANANNAASASTTSAAGSALAMAAMFAFSDGRLKEDVVEVGLLPSGVRVVHYRYRGRPRRYVGVIAQEVALVKPDAVILHPSGFLMVDYSKVF